MNPLKTNNPKGRLLTYQQVAENSNLGINTVMRLAKESNSIVRIGRTVRVNPEKFYEYILAKGAVIPPRSEFLIPGWQIKWQESIKGMKLR